MDALINSFAGLGEAEKLQYLATVPVVDQKKYLDLVHYCDIFKEIVGANNKISELLSPKKRRKPRKPKLKVTKKILEKIAIKDFYFLQLYLRQLYKVYYDYRDLPAIE